MAGDYECKATNEMGTANSRCQVKVNSKSITYDFLNNAALNNNVIDICR